MLSKQKTNKKNIHKRTFTIGEINHLLNLLYWNEKEGIYNGNKEQYWKRHISIIEKLSN
jgi:hypothetical protein